jgi:hypothetical protein
MRSRHGSTLTKRGFSMSKHIICICPYSGRRNRKFVRLTDPPITIVKVGEAISAQRRTSSCDDMYKVNKKENFGKYEYKLKYHKHSHNKSFANQ